MLKKTITFRDLDDNVLVEDFYFNLNKAELAQLELQYEGGFSKYLSTIVDAKGGKAIMDAFKSIIGTAYGVRSEDGKRFIKSEKISEEFMQTDAFSELFVELLSDAEAAATFVNAVMPASLVAQAQAEMAQGKALAAELIESKSVPEDTRPLWERENRDPNQKELRDMTPEQLQAAFVKRAQNSVAKRTNMNDGPLAG